MNKKIFVGIFLSIALMFAVAYAANIQYYGSTAATTNVTHTWGYRAAIVQVDPDDGSADTTPTWVSFDGETDSILIPATGLIIPLCDCASITVRRSVGSVSYGLWVTK